MNCTIRQVPEGIIATVGKRPTLNDYYIDTSFEGKIYQIKFGVEIVDKHCHKIIASNIDGIGKQLLCKYYGHETYFNPSELIKIDTEYPYTENETQLIIQL